MPTTPLAAPLTFRTAAAFPPQHSSGFLPYATSRLSPKPDQALDSIPRIRLEPARSNAQCAFLAIDTEPHSVDTLTAAPGTPAVWKYRAIYLHGDQPFGQWSDTATIAVQG